MRFQKISSVDPVVDYLVQKINSEIGNKHKVLWLLSGGSAMKIAVTAALKIREVPPGSLTITLADERYGPIDHTDSNWKQLIENGLNLPGAKMVPVLGGKDLDSTAKEYANLLQSEFEKADFVLALAGMGPDGHIFGIKPDSPSVDSELPVIGYEWEDYVRLTPTLSVLKKIDEVVVYTAGSEKHQQLDDLDKDLPPSRQPAQFLKQLKNVIIFNDYRND